MYILLMYALYFIHLKKCFVKDQVLIYGGEQFVGRAFFQFQNIKDL